MLSNDYLHHVELDTPLDVDVFSVSRADCLRAESRLFNARDATFQSTELGILALFEILSSLNDER